MKKRLLSLAAAVTMLTSVFTPVYANEIDLDVTGLLDDSVTLGLSLDEDELEEDDILKEAADWYEWNDATSTLTIQNQLPDTEYVFRGKNNSYYNSLARQANINPSYIEHIVIKDGTKTNTKASYMFYGMDNLIDIKGSLDTSACTDMSGMFYGCRKLTSVETSGFDTSNVTTMLCMFYGCNALTNANVYSFDTSNVTNMRMMFAECHSLRTSLGTTWDTSNVTDFSDMFLNCKTQTSLSLPGTFKMSSATDVSGMFKGCEELNYIEMNRVDIAKVCDMAGMFEGCTSLTSLNLGEINITEDMKLPNADYEYAGWTAQGSANHVVSGSGTYAIFATSGSRYYRIKNTQISSLMWDEETSTLTLSGQLPDTDGENFALLAGLYSENIKKVVIKPGTKAGKLLNGAFSGLYVESISGLNYLDTSSTTDMSGMFAYSQKLKSLDLSGFDTHNVEDMGNMFFGCSSLKSLNISNFDTSKLVYAQCMFGYCETINSLDLSSFTKGFSLPEKYRGNNGKSAARTGKSEPMQPYPMSEAEQYEMRTHAMFVKCSELTSLKLPKDFYVSRDMFLHDRYYDITGWCSPSGSRVSKTYHVNGYFGYTIDVDAAEFNADTAGTYKLMKPGQSPTITKIEPGNGKMTVYWTPIDNATGYTVYFTKSGGTEKSVERAASQTSAYIGGLENGTYSVYVKAIVNGKRTIVKNKATAVLKSYYVPCTTQATASGEITISWNKFSGAARYRVVCIDKNNNVRDTKTTSKLSFKWQGLKNGENYGFYVQPYIEPGVYPTFTRTDANDKKYIKWTCPVNSPMITKLSLGNQKLWVYYEKVPRATKYYIYYIPKGGSEKLAGTTTNNKFLVTGIKNGVATEFYVKALVDGKLTPLKRPATRTTRAGIKPTVTPASGQVTVKWDKYTDCKATATKYKVYLVDKDYKSCGYVETGSLAITINNLPRGVKLGVYVVPYVNGEYIPFGLTHADDKANVVFFTVK